MHTQKSATRSPDREPDATDAKCTEFLFFYHQAQNFESQVGEEIQSMNSALLSPSRKQHSRKNSRTPRATEHVAQTPHASRLTDPASLAHHPGSIFAKGPSAASQTPRAPEIARSPRRTLSPERRVPASPLKVGRSRYSEDTRSSRSTEHARVHAEASLQAHKDTPPMSPSAPQTSAQVPRTRSKTAERQSYHTPRIALSSDVHNPEVFSTPAEHLRTQDTRDLRRSASPHKAAERSYQRREPAARRSARSDDPRW